MQRLFSCIVLLLFHHLVFAQQDLNYYLDAARHNNPVSRLDSLQSSAARLALQQQKAALTGPSVYAEGGYLAAPVLATGSGGTRFLVNPAKTTTEYQGYDIALSNGGLYKGVVNLEQPIFTAPRTRVLENQQRLQDAQLGLHQRLTLHQLEKTVTDQYLLCQYTRQQQAVTNQVLDLIRAQSKVSETLARNALLYQADVQLLRIEADRLTTTIAVLDANYRSQLLDLNMLCGLGDTARVDLPIAHLQLADESHAASAFTEQYRLDSLNLTASQALFDLRYKPQLSFYTSAGLNASYAPDIAQRFGFMAGLRFTQVIFDGHQRQTTERRTHVLAQTTAIQTDYFKTQNSVRKVRLRDQLAALAVQDSAIHRQQQGYDTLLSLYRQQVMAGQLSVINYLTVLRSRASLQQDLAGLLYNRELLINEYNYWNW